jgi:hypothetical protein
MIELLTRLSLPEEEAIACMCNGCGRKVFADVHIVRVAGRLELWGSTCFAKVVTEPATTAWATNHGGPGHGPRLTAEQAAQLREELRANTSELLQQLEGVYAGEQAEAQRQSERKWAAPQETPRSPEELEAARLRARAAASIKSERDRRVAENCASAPRYTNFLPGWPKPEIIDEARWAEAKRRLPGVDRAGITREYWLLKFEEEADQPRPGPA